MKSKFKEVNINEKKEYLLIGRPNVGKSTIFNHATKSVQEIGNFARTTVVSKKGKLKSNKAYLVDLPGIYNLSSTGEDEMVALDSIFNSQYSGIVNVLSASSFKRDMHLAIQLLESEKDVFMNINMVDELNQRKINEVKLKKSLRCSVNLTIANKSIGVDRLKRELSCPIKGFKLNYGLEVEAEIKKIQSLIKIEGISSRFLAIQLLEGNKNSINYLKERQENYQEVLNAIKSENAYIKEIYNKRNEFINTLYEEAFIEDITIKNQVKSLSRRIDKLILQEWFGIPIFIFALMGVYYISFGPYTGGYIQGHLDSLLNDTLKDDIRGWLGNISSPWWLTSFLCDGLIAGVFGVIPFFPYIIILFFFVGLFQQSGYMSRVSAITDRLLSPFGISGRSVIGLISGMGCNVPMIMMARGSDSKKERMTAIFIAPFISCSARATVFAFIATMVFVNNIWLTVFTLQIVSGVFALLIGYGFSRTMFRRNPHTLIFEIPRWRVPDLKSISKLMIRECKIFLKRVAKFVLIGSIILWFLIHLGPTGLLDDEKVGISFIGYVSRGISYIMYPTGLSDYRLITSLLLAFPAKELAISNMLIVFGGQNNITNYFNFARALSYMVFFLLYIPCISTMATIKKESNWKMVLSNAGFSLLLAYLASIIVYQLAVI